MLFDRCIIFDASDKKLGLGILRRRGNYRYISRHPMYRRLKSVLRQINLQSAQERNTNEREFEWSGVQETTA